MSAAQYSFLLEQGATVTKQFLNQDINGNSVPFPIGTVAEFAVKQSPATITSANLILARSNDARLNLNAASGVITMIFSSNDTEMLLGPLTNLVYDLFLLFPSGAVTKMLTGSITILSSVTHV